MRLAGRHDGKDDTPDEDDVRPDDKPDYWTLRSQYSSLYRNFILYTKENILSVMIRLDILSHLTDMKWWPDVSGGYDVNTT